MEKRFRIVHARHFLHAEALAKAEATWMSSVLPSLRHPGEGRGPALGFSAQTESGIPARGCASLRLGRNDDLMYDCQMKIDFKTYDVADYLNTEKDMALYLEACFEEAGDDAATIAAALGDIARAKGMSDIAAATGLTREGLYRTLSKDGNPSFSAVLKVMKAMGLKLRPEAA